MQSGSDSGKEEGEEDINEQVCGGQEGQPNTDICLTSGSWGMWMCECAKLVTKACVFAMCDGCKKQKMAKKGSERRPKRGGGEGECKHDPHLLVWFSERAYYRGSYKKKLKREGGLLSEKCAVCSRPFLG